MSSVSRSAIVGFDAQTMYRLVADIESYPQFLPWCGGARIVSDTGGEVVATVDIAYKGVNKSFTTRNRQQPGEQIEMTLVEGPFRELRGVWRFQQLDDNACKITLDLDFEFANPILAMTIGKVFSSIADTLVDSFCQRAAAVSESGSA